jgi:hypothetical protein
LGFLSWAKVGIVRRSAMRRERGRFMMRCTGGEVEWLKRGNERRRSTGPSSGMGWVFGVALDTARKRAG